MRNFAKVTLPSTRAVQSSSQRPSINSMSKYNEMIKVVGGATRLLNRDEDSTLIRWEFCGSEVSKSTLCETQFQEFWSQRLVKAEVPVSDEVKNLRLPRYLVNGKKSVPKDPVLSVKMISFLRSANEFRTEEVRGTFFIRNF